jgi:hypothetical protein
MRPLPDRSNRGGIAMAIQLKCLPDINILKHGIEVTGRGKNVMEALIDAANKLNIEFPLAEKSLRKDAREAQCPDECKKKRIGRAISVQGITFRVAFDGPPINSWHCTIGIGLELEVTCEPIVEG